MIRGRHECIRIMGQEKTDPDDKLLNLTLIQSFFGTFSLDSEERATVMSLVNYDDVSCDILGIFKTNAMNISPSEAALYPWVCRANHSCDPNCNYYHNSNTGHQELYCTRVIRAGEEVLDWIVGESSGDHTIGKINSQDRCCSPPPFKWSINAISKVPNNLLLDALKMSCFGCKNHL